MPDGVQPNVKALCLLIAYMYGRFEETAFDTEENRAWIEKMLRLIPSYLDLFQNLTMFIVQ